MHARSIVKPFLKAYSVLRFTTQSIYLQYTCSAHRRMHRSTIFGMYEYAHNSKYMFFRACISESRIDCVWSRISSQNRRTVLISMLGASFSLFTVYLLGALKYAQSNPVLIRMLGASMYAQSNPVLIRMLGASKYAHSNHFWTSNIISICRCEHAHNSQCM